MVLMYKTAGRHTQHGELPTRRPLVCSMFCVARDYHTVIASNEGITISVLELTLNILLQR